MKASDKIRRIREINKQLYALSIKEKRAEQKRKRLTEEKNKLVKSLTSTDRKLYTDSLKRAKVL